MIDIDNVTVKAGDFVLHDACLRVPTGAYGALMGKTGSGKSTLLEAICGLKRVARGTIRLGGEDVTHLSPAGRGVGYVPQDGALFSRMTVRDHLAFALVVRHAPKAAVNERVGELADLLGIEYLLNRTPAGLSGGERQRVALGRALAFRPGILLLDEPLSAVDEHTREDMYALLKAVQKHTGVTTLHVTHSREETAALADCVFRLCDGEIQCLEQTTGDVPDELKKPEEEREQEG